LSRSAIEQAITTHPPSGRQTLTWDEKTIDQWLQNLTGDVHGSKMFITVPNAEDRQNVIAYLENLK
jgi:cytochrome c2